MGARVKEGNLAERTARDRTIVLIEEDAAIRVPLANSLRNSGFEVIEPQDAEEAVRAIERGAGGLLTDYYVRRSDGQGLVRWVRKAHPECTVVLLTSAADIHLAVDALEAGLVSRFALKSWGVREICSSVSLALQTPAAANQPESSGVHPTTQSRGRVLVVDDNDLVRPVLAKVLTRYGFKVITAADGAEALHLVDEGPIAVALVDLILPKVDGLEIVRYVKAHHPSCVVVGMSGLTNPDARDEIFRAGADDFLAKPVDGQELVKRVDGYMQMHQVRSAARTNAVRAERMELYAREMSSLLAHDLRNGFAAAESNLMYIERTAGLPEDVKAALDGIRRSLDRMKTLAGNLTEVDLLERGNLVANRKPTDVAQLVRTVLEVHRPAVRSEGVSIDLEAPAELIGDIDPALLERTLHNLLNNAARYVNQGGTIRVRARIKREREPFLSVEIGNTGDPVPEIVAASVFDAGATGDHRSRTGLGLYFCRLACVAHGGSISIEPHGVYQANFVLRLPLVEGQNDSRRSTTGRAPSVTTA